ncbi:hypothetical protein AGR5A_Lc70086 [Agrobacterium genomosp. 5 str. CFBP 6626]|nr:hypothetical protein AGR5A_Lc70086 [Agrobacterium genomosp. 5 str. CFBP 6626]
MLRQFSADHSGRADYQDMHDFTFD